MRERFEDKNFAPATLVVIIQANAILQEFSQYKLTLRQLYYQFVGHDAFPDDRRWRRIEGTNRWVRDPNGTKNAPPNYKWLGGIVNGARLAGLIDWDSIVDITRKLTELPTWDSTEEIIDSAAAGYTEDVWSDQAYRPEVWIEKEAQVSFIEPVCQSYRVPFFACRGYTSQTGVYEAGKRFAQHRRDGFTPIVFHLGDHDPSGIDMTRDNAERLAMFAREDVEVRRLALNWNQIEEYKPPPNPAKMTDSRFARYVDRFGTDSWELDALHPSVVERVISEAVESIIDRDPWDGAMEAEGDQRESLELVSEHWVQVQNFVRNL